MMTFDPTKRGFTIRLMTWRAISISSYLTGALVAITLIEGPREQLFPEIMSFFYCVVALPVGPGHRAS
jgi:hypothetical protein